MAKQRHCWRTTDGQIVYNLVVVVFADIIAGVRESAILHLISTSNCVEA